MDIIKAIILGVVQGITEFLPISSDGHLVIFDALIDLCIKTESSGTSGGNELFYTVVLHLGTLLSIVIVYRAAIWRLRTQPKVCCNLVIASVPAAVLGLVFKDDFERAFSTPLVAGLGLFVTAAMLVIGQRLERNEFSYEDLSPAKALLIGVFQAGALLPGVSRSGSTIAAGLLSGMQRGAAGSFSFLMAIPVITGAVIIELKDLLEGKITVESPAPLLVGAVTSFLVGLLVLRWLISLIARGRLHWFAYYCLAAGTLTVIWQLFASIATIE